MTHLHENVFNRNAFMLDETGKQSIRQLRSWAQSNGFELEQKFGGPEIWKSPDKQIILKIKPEPSYQDPKTAFPRFELQIEKGVTNQSRATFLNPFTNETGPRGPMSHVPLENPYQFRGNYPQHRWRETFDSTMPSPWK